MNAPTPSIEVDCPVEKHFRSVMTGASDLTDKAIDAVRKMDAFKGPIQANEFDKAADKASALRRAARTLAQG